MTYGQLKILLWAKKLELKAGQRYMQKAHLLPLEHVREQWHSMQVVLEEIEKCRCEIAAWEEHYASTGPSKKNKQNKGS